MNFFMIHNHSEFKHLGDKRATEVFTILVSEKPINLILYNVPFR